ncbi:MAG: glycosyl hydrolase [Bacteroidia bacterium]
MKFLPYLICLSLFLSLACKEEIPEIPAQKPPTVDSVDKKGAAFSHNKANWSFRVANLKPYWHYSWSNKLDEKIPTNVEFVPMFWGKGSVNDDNINRLKQLAAEGKIDYILGFNEPDGATQANMTVDEAIALWPRLEEIGVPIGSPATVSPSNDWMIEFMQKAKAQNLRIDFVCVHSYGGANVDNFINKMKETYERFDLPIWITEFAVADWNAGTPADNRYSASEIRSFMQTLMPQLYAAEYIERFSWFSSGPDNAALAPSSLFDADNKLTPLGQYYASYEPNADAGPGIETEVVIEDPDNLITNGTFETGEKTPWQGFKSGVLTSATTEPHTGGFMGRIENNDGSLFQVITVKPNQTYTLDFFSKWRDTVPNTFSMSLKQEGGAGVVIHQVEIPKSGDWTESQTEFTVPDSISSLRVLFYKPQATPSLPPFFLDDVVLKEK